MTAKKITAEIKETAKEPVELSKDPREFKAEDLISSGSTVLNCACSDTPWGAFKLGTIVTIPGTSQGGKTMEILTVIAEAVRDKRFDDYEIIYDDVEAALEIDVSYLFGERTEKRIKEPPLGPSNTAQNFKGNVLSLTNKGKSFIYGLDSWDALTTDEELEKEMRKALAAAKSEEAAKKIAGSYGMEKAKMSSQILRMIKREVEKTNSLLIILQQLRQNTDRNNPYSPKFVTSGGEAPYFYSTHQCWFSRTEHIKDKDLRIGSHVRVQVNKNKLTGKYREVTFPIYNDYGIDDTASCVNFMVDEKFWNKDGHSIEAVDLDLKLRKTELIAHIEENGLERKLQRAVGRAWKEREDSIKLHRKKRYE